MTDLVSALLKQKKIDNIQYKLFLIFAANDIGRELLKDMQQSVLMEEPLQPTNDLFAWHDGRRSVWRDIQRTINIVQQHIEEMRNDPGTSSRKQ